MTAPRPGLILVRSQPSDPDFTAVDLTAWYEEKHIAEVLATGRVKRAVRYQIANLPARDDVQCQDTGAKMPYLAVYSLEDMNWLHEEGCEFWKLPLTVKHGKGGEEKNIFKVAAFKTEFWDVIGRLDLREDDEGWLFTWNRGCWLLGQLS